MRRKQTKLKRVKMFVAIFGETWSQLECQQADWPQPTYHGLPEVLQTNHCICEKFNLCFVNTER